MVKKASSLMSLDELNLSPKTESYIWDKYYSIDKVVWEGRYAAYKYAEDPDLSARGPKYMHDLIQALDLAGYIRRDITSGSFCIDSLYQEVFAVPGMNVVTRIEDLGNKGYEDFKNPSITLVKTMLATLYQKLGGKDGGIVGYYFGFWDSKAHSIPQTALYFDLSQASVRYVLKKSMHVLKYENPLPAVFKTPDKQKEEVESLIKEIEKLRRRSLPKKEAELKQRLYEISKLPFDCAQEIERYLKSLNPS